MQQTIKTVQRNKTLVGRNSTSYNKKHPINPVIMKPIRKAIEGLPKIIDRKEIAHLDYKTIHRLRCLGNLPRTKMQAAIRMLTIRV